MFFVTSNYYSVTARKYSQLYWISSEFLFELHPWNTIIRTCLWQWQNTCCKCLQLSFWCLNLISLWNTIGFLLLFIKEPCFRKNRKPVKPSRTLNKSQGSANNRNHTRLLKRFFMYLSPHSLQFPFHSFNSLHLLYAWVTYMHIYMTVNMDP